ncbi:reverse transcriptase [Plakobranchus ocellatus]|uniref:Reverse transcriptase n=1 Tax=Plakobranchus ocellatus TaxID=259542 RepID=A0AAV3Y7G8_9GAST|nr:reverse transcriptase [Plakobranchus ocellatus]
MKDDPRCPLCQGKQTTEHVLNSCKVALSQGRFTWRHNSLLLELARAICDTKSLLAQPKAKALVFTSEDGKNSWCGSAAGMDTQRKSLMNGCDDWEYSADLPKWNRHPKAIQDTVMRPYIVFHSSTSQQIIMYHTREEWMKQIYIKEKNTRT